MAEKRQFDLLPVKLAGPRMKADGAQGFANATAPLAVRPRADNQRIDDAGIEPLGPAVGLQRPEEVLRVEPPADRHHGAADVLEVWPDVPGLPPAIISRVCQELRPRG
jgi:hypothetical protein